MRVSHLSADKGVRAQGMRMVDLAAELVVASALDHACISHKAAASTAICAALQRYCVSVTDVAEHFWICLLVVGEVSWVLVVFWG
jgi:hypothetical protein